MNTKILPEKMGLLSKRDGKMGKSFYLLKDGSRFGRFWPEG
jgi:hypothetical protein